MLHSSLFRSLAGNKGLGVWRIKWSNIEHGLVGNQLDRFVTGSVIWFQGWFEANVSARVTHDVSL